LPGAAARPRALRRQLRPLLLLRIGSCDHDVRGRHFEEQWLLRDERLQFHDCSGVFPFVEQHRAEGVMRSRRRGHGLAKMCHRFFAAALGQQLLAHQLVRDAG
jgi:hypothetical protein